MSNSKNRVSYSSGYTMPRPLNLRQVEIFKAVMELGTVSRAAEALNVSQPAASKLLMQLEADHDLKLFDRTKGRLIPTDQSLHLYAEVERIFAGVRQVESAIDFIKREDQRRLVIGLAPGLAGYFIRKVTTQFLADHPNVYCMIQSRRSRWLVEQVLTRQVDVSISAARVDNAHFVSERFTELPLICIMPPGHPLERHDIIRPEHLKSVPFVAFDLDSYTGQKVDGVLQDHAVKPDVVITADAVATVTECVSAGLGVSLVYPLFVAGIENRFAIRPFMPNAPMDQFISYARDARNMDLILAFSRQAQITARESLQQVQLVWR